MNTLFTFTFLLSLSVVNAGIGPYRWVGNVNDIPGGFSCGRDTDAEIDANLNAACELAYPGSFAATGEQLADYQNIIDMPLEPNNIHVPACPNCRGCDLDLGRNCIIAGLNNWTESTWLAHGGEVLGAVCLVETVVVEPPSCTLLDRLMFAHSGSHLSYKAILERPYQDEILDITCEAISSSKKRPCMCPAT